MVTQPLTYYTGMLSRSFGNHYVYETPLAELEEFKMRTKTAVGQIDANMLLRTCQEYCLDVEDRKSFQGRPM